MTKRSGKRITIVDGARQNQLEVNRLRRIIHELLEVYWGEGDGAPPPDFIKRAQAEVAALKIDELRGVGVSLAVLDRLEAVLKRTNLPS